MPCVRRAPTPSFSFPTPTSSPYIIIPNGIPHNTIPLTATQPHTILTHTTPQHHPPYTIPHTPPPSCPWSHTIYPTPSATSKPGTGAPCGTCSASLGFSGYPAPSEDRVSNRAHRGCREEGRHGVPNRVGAGGWCKGPTVPCLCPLSLLEGDTPCTGQQPLTQWDLGCPGTRICGGWVDLGPAQAQHKD